MVGKGLCARHFVHDDVFGVVAAADMFALQIVGAHERDHLVAHAGRRGSGHEQFDAIGAVAGFLGQLARGGCGGGFGGIVEIADESGRHFDRFAAHGFSPLLDEQDVVVRRDRNDDHAAARVRALGEFPATAPLQA